LTIQKRWSKKLGQQRKQILVTAWGSNMATSHRPDFDTLKKKDRGHASANNDDPRRQALLWPYINLQDLSRQRLMLLFLDARSRHHPEAFARADREAAHIGIVSQQIAVPFLNERVIMFTGRRTPQTYGELIAWEDHPDAFGWLTSKRGHHPGEGLLILEIQDRLYAFLVKFCETILHDISPEAMNHNRPPTVPEQTLVLNSAGHDGLISLATIAEEAPYRVPADLDLGRLESIIEAKLSAEKDHLLALREDPGYFADNVVDWKEHRQENLLDTMKRKHPIFDNRLKERVLWERAVGNMLTTSFFMLEVWTAIHERLGVIQRLKTQHASDIRPESDLPERYLSELLKLYFSLRQFANGPIGVLKVGFPGSPPMRSYWVREEQDPSSTIIRVFMRKNIKDKTANDLLWLFGLLIDKDQLFLVGLSNLVDEMATLIENDSKSKALVSAWVADQIGDLAVIAQCIHQLDLYQPWAATFEDAMVDHGENLKADFAAFEKRVKPYLEVKYSRDVVELGTPTQGRFWYPVDKRRTQENVQAMRAAEAHLDEFWGAVIEELSKSSALSPVLRELLLEQVLERTAEWTELERRPQVTADIPTDTQPFGGLTSQPERVNAKSIIQEIRVKAKTRGVAHPVDDLEQEPLQHAEESELRQFKVDKRAFKVFKILFYTPNTNDHPGEIPWTDYLHAFRAVGFSVEKMHGSAWQFTPSNLDVERGIQFHEPHPNKKLPFKTARRYGRRLSRNYGWHGKMFILE
jgi:hypothetical protein